MQRNLLLAILSLVTISQDNDLDELATRFGRSNQHS